MEKLLKYKETEFGKIPEEWNIVCFQEFIDKIQSGVWGEDAIDKKMLIQSYVQRIFLTKVK